MPRQPAISGLNHLRGGLSLLSGSRSRPRGATTELILLTVPDCPNALAFAERLAAALADRPDVTLTRREIADERAAAAAGMHGSPTLLVNGTDPFAMPGQAASLSCRIYRDDAGRAGPAPSVEALRRAIAAAGDA